MTNSAFVIKLGFNLLFFMLITLSLYNCDNDVYIENKQTLESKEVASSYNSKIYPYIDTIFLDFKFGMSETNYNRHVKKLIAADKLKLKRNSLVYTVSFEKTYLPELVNMSSGPKITKSFKYDGVITSKIGETGLHELVLTFEDTDKSSSLSPKVYHHLVEILKLRYGNPKTFESNESSMNDNYPKYFYKRSVWAFSGSINIVLKGEFARINQDEVGPLLISERIVSLTYTNGRVRDKNVNIATQKKLKEDIDVSRDF